MWPDPIALSLASSRRHLDQVPDSRSIRIRAAVESQSDLSAACRALVVLESNAGFQELHNLLQEVGDRKQASLLQA